jgi:hypothetical protein
MATYVVIEATPIYYVIDVSFLGMTFRQLIATELLNGNLDTMLQAYADQYEHDWQAMQTESLPAPEPV